MTLGSGPGVRMELRRSDDRQLVRFSGLHSNPSYTARDFHDDPTEL